MAVEPTAAASALIGVLLVSLLSLLGASSLAFGVLRRHGVAMFLIALAAGTLLGDAVLHLLPEAAHDGFTTAIGGWLLAGFLVMFLLETVLRHNHAHAEDIGLLHDDATHSHDHDAGLEGVRPVGWVNLAGDALHNFLDGIIIAAAFLIDPAAGIATTIAVALHEIPQELGDFAVLVRSGMAPATALMLNLGTALFAVVGAALVLFAGLPEDAITAIAVPLIAGAFLYIAAADLVPELHHHSSARHMLIIGGGLGLGLLAMWLLLGLEGLAPVDHAHG